MTIDLYLSFRIIAATIIATLGVCLYFAYTPLKLRGSIFESSRKMMGLVFLAIPTATYIIYFSKLRYDLDNQYFVIVYLTACFVKSLLITASVIPLLGNRMEFSGSRVARKAAISLLFPMPMVAAHLFGNKELVNITMIISSLILLTTIIYQCNKFRRRYNIAIKLTRNYYADDIEVEIDWILKSVYLLFSTQFIYAASIYFPTMGLWLELAITLSRVVVIAYVMKSFTDFTARYDSTTKIINASIPDSLEECCIEECCIEESYKRSKSTLNQEVIDHIAKQLNIWIENRGFTHQGITINSVAMDVYTNRTYLSIYINSTYGCSFKSWITSLRIELSKKLLLEKKSFTIEEIYQDVGFASATSFTHTFKRHEGDSPSKWKKREISQRLDADNHLDDNDQLITSGTA